MSNEAQELRHTLVRHLIEAGVLRSRHTRHAMLTIPRHLFTPWLTIEDAYSDWSCAGFTDTQLLEVSPQKGQSEP